MAVKADRAGAVGLTWAGVAEMPWLALERLLASATALERATPLLELVHAHGWKSGRRVMLLLVVVNLMDRHGGVDNMRLNGFCLHFSIEWSNRVEVRGDYAFALLAGRSHERDGAHVHRPRWALHFGYARPQHAERYLCIGRARHEPPPWLGWCHHARTSGALRG